MNKLLLLFLLIPVTFGTYSQLVVPGTLKSPVPIPVYISGSFSELRGNHFHGGIDIRTNSQVGIPVLAAADGFVSKITIEAGNYGKTLYIEHPGGITTVYAHLQSFSKTIEDYVFKQQKLNETYEIELNIDPRTFYFKQGDTIAYSGNSGASRAPHLHFEVRESHSNWVINPLLYGFEVRDEIPPVITGVRLYPVGDNSCIEIEYYGKHSTYTKKYFSPVNVAFYKSGGIYRLSGVRMVRVQGSLGVGVECRDMMNECGNILDIYKGELSYKGNIIFSQTRNRFSLEDTRYINAHRDFREKFYHARNFQRFFLLPNNKITFYDNVINNGLISPLPEDTGKVSLKLFDHHLNQAKLEFEVTGTSILPEDFPVEKEVPYQKLFYYDRPNYYSTEKVELFFPENSFYENLKFECRELPGKNFTYSPVFKIHYPDEPVQNAYTIRIKADKVPVAYQSKALIAEISGENYRGVGGGFQDGWVESKVNTFGQYAIVVDSVAPVVKTINFVNGSNLKYAKDLKVSIYDHISGIKSYKAYLDEQWILMEYDKKKNLLTHYFTEQPDGNEHLFRLIVSDQKDNIREIIIKFKR